MQRDEAGYLHDMLLYARKIQEHVHSLTRTEFEENEFDCCGDCLLPSSDRRSRFTCLKEYRQIQPSIPWDSIARMRNRLVHNYFDINYTVVWLAATTEMQPLIDTLKNLVSDD